MHIKGRWFTAGGASNRAATMRVENTNFYIHDDLGAQLRGDLINIQVADRLGNVERKLTLPDGSVFATKNNHAVDNAFKDLIRGSRFIHKVESNLGWVIFALLLSVATTFSFFRWGLPWVSDTVAHALPQKTSELIGSNTLEFLDEYIFAVSELSPARQDEIKSHFQSNLLPAIQDQTQASYQLHFRAWGEGDTSIANALALPSGDIILTDRFIELADSQAEIDSVVLHEIGHVVHRHTLEMITQSTLTAAILAVFTGDASGAADMGIGLGSLLVTAGFSRSFENEADKFAFETMLSIGIDPNAFATILTKISEDAEIGSNTGKTQPDESKKESSTKEDSLIDYISTHPTTAQRIAQAKRYAECYQKTCDLGSEQ